MHTAGTSFTHAFVTALWDPKALDNIVDLDLTSSVDREKHALKRLRRGYLIRLRHTLIAKSSQSQDTETVLLEVKDLVSKFSVGYGRSGTDKGAPGCRPVTRGRGGEGPAALKKIYYICFEKLF